MLELSAMSEDDITKQNTSLRRWKLGFAPFYLCTFDYKANTSARGWKLF
jgi:hypothetical protein